MFNGDVIFEAHEEFIKEHYSEFQTNPVKQTLQLLGEDVNFKAYVDKLTEALDPVTKASVELVLERQRQTLLEEANVTGPSALAYAINYFPILVDIFSEPIISKIATVHTVSSGSITIPRIRFKTIIKKYDGSQEELYIPTAAQYVGAPTIDVELTPVTRNNLFTLAGLSANDYTVNKRFFTITKLTIIDNDGTTDNTIEVPVFIRPDIRGGFSSEVKFTDSAGAETIVFISGKINYADGTVQFTGDFTGGTSGHTYTLSKALASVRFNPLNTSNGRVIVKIENEGFDIDIDVNNDFEISLPEEMIQDFKDIYNIDAIRDISQAIKAQILLNVDYEIMSLLRGNEDKFAASVTLDYTNYAGNGFAPNSVRDLLFAIVPKILVAARAVKRAFQAMPQYIIASNNTAPLLESLQEFYVMYNSEVQGALKGVDKAASFKKFDIITSDACPDDKVYVVYKAPVGQLSRTAIAHVIYKPLYIIEETTDSVRRTFVRSRTAVELPRPDACAVVNLVNSNIII